MVRYIMMSTILSACTAIYIDGGKFPVNVQTTDSVNVLGSQNVVSSDRASKGAASGSVVPKQGATTPNTAILPLPGRTP